MTQVNGVKQPHKQLLDGVCGLGSGGHPLGNDGRPGQIGQGIAQRGVNPVNGHLALWRGHHVAGMKIAVANLVAVWHVG